MANYAASEIPASEQPPGETQADAALSDEHAKRREEALNLARFHRTEAERWGRIARAYSASLIELESREVIPDLAPEPHGARPKETGSAARVGTAVAGY